MGLADHSPLLGSARGGARGRLEGKSWGQRIARFLFAVQLSVASALQLYLGIQNIILGTKFKEADLALARHKGVPPYILCSRHLTSLTLVPALKTVLIWYVLLVLCKMHFLCSF